MCRSIVGSIALFLQRTLLRGSGCKKKFLLFFVKWQLTRICSRLICFRLQGRKSTVFLYRFGIGETHFWNWLITNSVYCHILHRKEQYYPFFWIISAVHKTCSLQNTNISTFLICNLHSFYLPYIRFFNFVKRNEILIECFHIFDRHTFSMVLSVSYDYGILLNLPKVTNISVAWNDRSFTYTSTPTYLFLFRSLKFVITVKNFEMKVLQTIGRVTCSEVHLLISFAHLILWKSDA